MNADKRRHGLLRRERSIGVGCILSGVGASARWEWFVLSRSRRGVDAGWRVRLCEERQQTVESDSLGSIFGFWQRDNARDERIVLCLSRLRMLAHRMLSRHPKLRRYEDTSDLVQNAAVRLQTALASAELGSPRSVIALAVTQLNRELCDMIRRNNARLRWERTAGASASGEAAEDHALEDWTRFHEAVEALPQEQRDAVQYLWYLGLDQETAAANLGVSTRTLRRYWRDGRDTIRQTLPDFSFE